MNPLGGNLEFIIAAEEVDNLEKDEKWEEIRHCIESLPEWMRNSAGYQVIFQKANHWLALIEKTKLLNLVKDPKEYENLLRLLNQQESCKSKDQLLQAFILQTRNNIIPVMADWDSSPCWYDGSALQQLMGVEVEKAQEAKRIEKLCQKANDLMQSSPDQWLNRANKVLGMLDETSLELGETGCEIKENLRRVYDSNSRLSTLEQSLAQVEESLRQIEIDQAELKKSLGRVLLGGGIAGVLVTLLIIGCFLSPLIQPLISPNSSIITPIIQSTDSTFIATFTQSISGYGPTQPMATQEQETQTPNAATPTLEPIDTPTPTTTPVPTPRVFQMLAENPAKTRDEVNIFISEEAASDVAYILNPNNFDNNNQDGKVKIMVYATGEEKNARLPVTLKFLIESKFVLDNASPGLITLQNVNDAVPHLYLPNPADAKGPISGGYVLSNGLTIPVKRLPVEDAEDIPETFIWIEIGGWIETARLTPLADQ